jgi:hypothetical protein
MCQLILVVEKSPQLKAWFRHSETDPMTSSEARAEVSADEVDPVVGALLEVVLTGRLMDTLMVHKRDTAVTALQISSFNVL